MPKLLKKPILILLLLLVFLGSFPGASLANYQIETTETFTITREYKHPALRSFEFYTMAPIPPDGGSHYFKVVEHKISIEPDSIEVDEFGNRRVFFKNLKEGKIVEKIIVEMGQGRLRAGEYSSSTGMEKYLMPMRGIESDHPDIKAAADKLFRGVSDNPYDRAKKVFEFIQTHMTCQLPHA